MKLRHILSLVLAVFMIGLASGCAPVTVMVEVTQAVDKGPAAVRATAPAPESLSDEKPAAPQATMVAQVDSEKQVEGGYQSNRMIIKNGEINIEVEDTDTAIDRVTQVVTDMGGYIISSRQWMQISYEKNYKYATLSMGVPSDQFENALRRLRGIAMRVLDENTSGEDVTNQYVDLQSQLDNLTATRDRIRTFLEEAKTVEEALKVNEELSKVEGQIEEIQGKMKYLSGRASYSTLTVQIVPFIPTPAPTLTPTPTPTSTPVVWNPAQRYEQSRETLISAYQGMIELAIWVGVVCVPILAPPAVVLGLVIWFAARWRGSRRKPAAVIKEVKTSEPVEEPPQPGK